MRDPQDTVENNLMKGTGNYVPDNVEEVQTMRFRGNDEESARHICLSAIVCKDV